MTKFKLFMLCLGLVFGYVIGGYLINDPTIKIDKIIDGDTFVDTRGIYYRFESYDAPEKHEPGYDFATTILRAILLVQNNGDLPMECTRVGRGKYDRVLVKCPALERDMYAIAGGNLYTLKGNH